MTQYSIIKKFEVGKTYRTGRRAYTIIGRSDKYVTVTTTAAAVAAVALTFAAADTFGPLGYAAAVALLAAVLALIGGAVNDKEVR